MEKKSTCQASHLIVAFDNQCLCVHKKVSHLPSQLGIFVFTFTVKRFHIYGALLHLALKVFTFTGPYYIFTFRGATDVNVKLHMPSVRQNQNVAMQICDQLYLPSFLFFSGIPYHVYVFLNSIQKLTKNDVRFQSFDFHHLISPNRKF